MLRLVLSCWLLICACLFQQVSAQAARDSSAVIDVEKIYQYLVGFERPLDRSLVTPKADSLLNAAKQQKQKLQAAYLSIYLRYAEANDRVKQLSGARYFQDISPSIQQLNYLPLTAWFKFKLGQIHIYEENPLEGFSMMLEAVSECRSYGFSRTPLISYMLYDLSNIYYRFNNYRQSISFSLEAQRYSERYPSSASIVNTLGMCYQKLGIYDSAQTTFQQAIALARSHNDTVWLAISTGNLGRTQCLQGNYRDGLAALHFDLATNAVREPINSSITALHLAEAHRLMGRLDSAMYYIIKSVDLYRTRFAWASEQLAKSHFGRYYYYQLAQWHAASKQFEQAFRWQDSARVYDELYRAQHNLNLIAASEKRVQGLEFQQSLDLAEVEKKNATLRSLLLGIFLIATLIIGVLVVSRQRLKHLKERQLYAERERNLELLRQQADQELEQAQIQLADYVRYMSEKNALIERISAELEEQSHQPLPPESVDSLDHMRQQLVSASLLTKADWELFQRKFDRVYPGFFNRVRVVIPGVTASDERLFALGKLTLSTQHMAMMLGISPESVRKARYRLRKKLSSLPEAESVSDLLETL